MPPLSWEPGAFPSPGTKSVPVVRFTDPNHKKRRWRVWLLGDPIQRGVHFRIGQGSAPCLRPEACPICDLNHEAKVKGWSKQFEGYAPALVMRKNREYWDFAVVVLTSGVLKTLVPQSPLRGWRGEFFREYVGSSPRLKYEAESDMIEPPVQAFDVTGVMERLWDPFAQTKLPELPEGVPANEPVFRPQPSPIGQAEANRNREYAEAVAEAARRGESFDPAKFHRDRAEAGKLIRDYVQGWNDPAGNRNKRDLGHDQPESELGAGSVPETAASATPGAGTGIPATSSVPVSAPVSAKTADQPKPSSKDQADVFAMSLKSMAVEEIEAFIRVTPRLPGFAALVDAARAEIESRPTATPPSDIQMSPTPPTPKATPRSDTRMSLDGPEPLDTDAILLKFGTGKILCDEVGAALPNGHPSKPGKGKGGRS